jgi:3-polyprenyl-4-hydroxybenzoate decarboxylase
VEDEKRNMWQLLARSELLDQFLQKRFPNVKRYGLEGAEGASWDIVVIKLRMRLTGVCVEAMMVALDRVFTEASKTATNEIVLFVPCLSHSRCE